MTKEELKEMIDSTINTNGNKEITGNALNLALNAIVDSMGQGSGFRHLYMSLDPQTGKPSDLPEDQKQSNALLYSEIKEAFISESAFPLIETSFSINSISYFNNIPAFIIGLEGDTYTIVAYINLTPEGRLILLLNEDGTLLSSADILNASVLNVFGNE